MAKKVTYFIAYTFQEDTGFEDTPTIRMGNTFFEANQPIISHLNIVHIQDKIAEMLRSNPQTSNVTGVTVTNFIKIE